MAWWPPTWWLRLRAWLARLLGLWRGRWQRFEVEAPAARGLGFGWPWARQRWSCALYLPGGLADRDEAPLVLLLHGCRQEAMGFAQASGWVAAAERGRFRLLCPEQPARANPFRCWNWFLPAAQEGQGELEVVLQALAVVRAQRRSGAVAVVGLSAGGGLAALLAFHGADRVDAVVAVAAPPLLGRANLQDPLQVMRQGLALEPTRASARLSHCAPLLVLHGAEDDVVAPRCAEQLAAQALDVMAREHGALEPRALPEGAEYLSGGRVVLRRLLVPGLGHAWTGAPGGHAYVVRDGPPLTTLALDFLRGTLPAFRR